MLYPVAIEQGDEQHAFGVIVPDIPGCFSAGDTLEEALSNVKEAIEFHLSGLAEDKESLPDATNISHHLHNPDYAGFIWAVIDIDISRFMGKSIKINVTLPDYLINRVDRFATQNKKYKSNRSAVLADAAREFLQRHQ